MHVCSRCSVACSSGHICLWSQGRRSETQRQRLHHVAACVQEWLSILAQWWDYSMQLFYSHALALPLWHNWNETFNTATSGSFSCLIVDFIHVQLNDTLPVCSCGNFSQRSLVTTTGQCFLVLGWVLLYWHFRSWMDSLQTCQLLQSTPSVRGVQTTVSKSTSTEGKACLKQSVTLKNAHVIKNGNQPKTHSFHIKATFSDSF